MKIKRIEICGFKSFVDRTAISFPDPITAIVGPNGCGKSNIVDAVRWVMGEQSAKHLRGRAMEDVIFAGSETRGPAGLAEVSLTFDGAALAGDVAPGGVPWGVVAPTEIVVTRRLYRDGESEYLLNGVPSRLRDVVDFFLGTGVGSKAYAIIEQGRIGFIVSSRPEDRRGLIDEAAGITKYKVKKRAAERRIDSTRHHLLRVSDIIGEIEGRLRSLRLQAQKAERYKRYKAELKDLDLWSAAQRFLGHLAEEKALSAEIGDLRERHGSAAVSLEGEEAAVEAERLGVTEEMGELAAAKDDLFALSNRAQLSLQRASHHEDEAAQLGGRAAASRREIDELGARTAAHAGAIGDLDGQLVRLDDEAAASRADHEGKAREHDDLRAELAGARAALDAAVGEGASARARIARNESERSAAAARCEDLERRLADIEAEDGDAAERLAALGAEAAGLRAALDETDARRAERAAERKDAEGRLGSLRAEASRGELELETLREEAHRRRSRLASLSEIQDRYESFQKGVRAIMQKRREREGQGEASGIKAVVADIVQPPPELEAAVEAVLGERLGNVIVESHDVGVEAIEYLKARSEGRSSFIPLALRTPLAAAPVGSVVYDAAAGASAGASAELGDSMGGAAGDGAAAGLPLLLQADGEPAGASISSIWPTGDGVRGPMLELIGYDRAYDRVAAHLLGDVLVVENLARALELWRETRTDKTIVTLDGEVVDPHGVVTGGSRESSVGVLEQKREIRELGAVVAKLETDQQEALERHLAVKQQLGDVLRTIDELSAALREDEMAVVALRKDLDRAAGDIARIEGRRRELGRQAAELGAARDSAQERQRTAGAALEMDLAVADAAEARATELRDSSTTLGDRLDVVVAERTALSVAAAQAEDRRNNARVTLSRLTAERAEHEQRILRLEQAITEELARAEVLRGDAARLREEATLAQAEAEARAREHGERQGAVEERHAALTRREAELRAARAEAARLGQTLSRLELRCQEVSMRRGALEEQTSARYADVRLEAVVFDYHLRRPVGVEEDERMTELRGLIERMGEINLTAIEESQELQARFDYLTAQRADLESALSQLEAAIDKINKASRKRFRETFDAIDAKFREVYPRMFGGGRAHLTLTGEGGDILEAGVDIVANPPGKKVMQNIELLSGGEKALTAVSLLFAIFLVKPSPFCVLDEVDAPLDEANVGRFNQMVRAMTDRSQFIIITHNRRTMEIADRLSGITMEEPGISKMVSVSLRGGGSGGGSGESTGKAAKADRVAAVSASATAPAEAAQA
jgi:chromosome segregation protein